MVRYLYGSPRNYTYILRTTLMLRLISVAASIVLLSMALSSSVSATVISYSLSNKAPGAQNPPDYGLRLDDLFGTSGSAGVWTFGFEGPGSNVMMDVNTTAQTVRIHGTVVGGRDMGTVWEGATVARWELDFLYNTNISVGLDGYWNVPGTSSGFNFGTMKLIDMMGNTGGGYFDSGDLNDTIGLTDHMGGHFTASGGPNGLPYVSAWLSHTGDFGNSTYFHTNYMDFGFSAKRVPEPVSLLLMGLGLLGLGSLRRSAKMV